MPEKKIAWLKLTKVLQVPKVQILSSNLDRLIFPDMNILKEFRDHHISDWHGF